MAILVNNVAITIREGDPPQQWAGTIPNNSDTFQAIATRIPSAEPFPPGEIREAAIDLDLSTDGGVNWTLVGGCVYRESQQDSQKPGGIALYAFIPRSAGRRLRTTVTRSLGTLKFNIFAEIV